MEGVKIKRQEKQVRKSKTEKEKQEERKKDRKVERNVERRKDRKIERRAGNRARAEYQVDLNLVETLRIHICGLKGCSPQIFKDSKRFELNWSKP